MTHDLPKYYHLHLVSDSTGETLATIAKAVTVQYAQMRALEHVHPRVLESEGLKSVLKEISSAPGIVLYTIIDKAVANELEQACQKLGMPCIAVLDPVMSSIENYLGLHKIRNVAGQHVLDSDYYRRIDALDFALRHDNGMNIQDLDRADVIILGATRTSKTPTTIYLADRGIRTANLPVVAGKPLPEMFSHLENTYVVGLTTSPENILTYLRAKSKKLGQEDESAHLPDLEKINADIEETKRLCAARDWPLIDISAHSIEETAAEILQLYRDQQK